MGDGVLRDAARSLTNVIAAAQISLLRRMIAPLGC
jgi:hypothetical protein